MLNKSNKDLLKRIDLLKYQKKSLSGCIKEKLIYASHIKILSQLEKIFENESPDQDKLLEKILIEYWEVLKHGSLLTYTALPTDDVTLFLCDIAEYLSRKTKKPALSFLMPDVEIEEIMGKFSDLTGNVKEIIRTHILSTNGKYLIPIGLLSHIELEKDWSNKKFWGNPYFNYSTMDKKSVYLNKEETLRLKNHSSDTAELFAIKEQYESFHNDGSLFSHLLTLVRSFQFNSKKQAGSELLAGEAVYSAIIRFNDYYKQLTTHQKNKIPNALKKEIDFIFELCSDKKINHDSTQVVETCVNIRQETLEKLIFDSCDILYSINIENADDKEFLIKEIKSNFISSQKELLTKIDKEQYNGCDRLNINHIALDHAPITIRLFSSSDVGQLLKLSPAEISLILNRYVELQDKLEKIEFNSLENLKMITLDFSSDRVEAILSVIGNKIASKLFPDIDTFLNFSSTLTDEYFSAISICLNALMQNTDDFYYIFYAFSSERINILLDKVKDNIFKIIKVPNDFHILSYFNEHAADMIFDKIRSNLKSFIKNEQDFCTVISHLNEEQCRIVCQTMGDDFWRSVINNGFAKNNKLVFILHSLDSAPCKALCEFIKSKHHKFYESIISFSGLLNALDEETFSIACKTFKEIIPFYLTQVDDFDYFLNNEITEKTLFEIISEKLASLTRNVKDLKRVLSYLDSSKEAFLEMIKENLSEIVKNEEDFNRIQTLTTYKSYGDFKEKFFGVAITDDEISSTSCIKRFR